jgi:Regulator of ribonuclease activity B
MQDPYMIKPSRTDRNAMVRSVLADRGDSGRTPRHTFFFFYGGDFAGLRNAATRAGYKVRLTVQRDGVVLEATIAIDEHSFATHAQRMEAWAEEFDCEYDGWECQLLNQ